MKYQNKFNKAIALILCICILAVNIPLVANSAETVNTQDVIIYKVPVISNEYWGASVDFYEYQGKYYLDVQDIKNFTRSTVEESSSSIKLVHGLREIEIDKATGHMLDSTVADQGNIPFILNDGKYLCEGIPMLMYLGAGCALRDNSILEIMMPSITIWESIMPNYLEYVFDITEIYGGENNVKIALVCDILADILNGAGGHGLSANGDTHLEDALYEILNIDMMKYASVQDSMAVQNQNMNGFLSSDALMTAFKTGDDAYGAVKETVEYYANFFLESEIYKNLKVG